MVLLSQLFTGLSLGSILLLIALGLTFTFGQMGVINMAHGELIMVGAYSTYVLQRVVTDPGLSLLVALPLAFAVAGALGALLEWALLRRLYDRPLDTLLVTWGVSLILQQVAKDLFGAPSVAVDAPAWLGGGLNLGSLTLPYARIAILVLVGATLLVVWLSMSRLALGRRMRAVVQNRQLAAVSGVHTGRVDRTTFFIGSGLAGLAGVALTLLGSISPYLGTSYIVDAFLVVVVGGLGQLRGAVVAAFALGLLNAYVEYQTTASVAKVIVFLAIVGFLQLRPQGIAVLRTRSLA